MSPNIKILSEAANQARGLCMDAVEASKSGHLGLPLGCAEMAAVLWGQALKYNPDEPRWLNRDMIPVCSTPGPTMAPCGSRAMAGANGSSLPTSPINSTC